MRLLPLTARGRTNGEIVAHVAELDAAKGLQAHNLEDHREGGRGAAQGRNRLGIGSRAAEPLHQRYTGERS
jgi:hypothetical protein